MDLVVCVCVCAGGVCLCVCSRCVFVCAGDVPDYLAEQHIAASLPVSRGLRRAIASDYL